MNDGSTDNSAEILAEYAAKDADDLSAAVKNAGLHITMPVFCYSSSCRSGRKRAHVSQRLREKSPERYKGKGFSEKIRSRVSSASPSAVSMHW